MKENSYCMKRKIDIKKTQPSYLFHKFKERPLVGRQEDENDEKI